MNSNCLSAPAQAHRPWQATACRIGARLGWLWVSISVTAARAFAADSDAPPMDPTKLPPAATTKVDFDRDIKPLLENRCYRCHGPERPKSGFRLDTRETALKGGEHGVDIVPGQSAKSPLVYYVARLVEDMEMPPAGKGDPLTPEQVGLLRAWIDQGAPWSATATARTKTLFSVTPSFAWISVSGNKKEFREQTGLNDGASGGVQDFRFQERSVTGLKLDVQGRALANQHDYLVQATIEKPDFGFTRFGYEQFRKYYDDTGGFVPQLGSPALSLGRDLYVDVGHAWFDVGLTLPDWPRIVLGYEYQYKEGSKSTLAWSDVVPAPTAANQNPAAVYPNYKDLDEHTHILKLDVSHDISGVHLEDNFRAEFYTLETSRFEASPVVVGSSGPDSVLRYHEDYSHVDAVNTLRAEKQLTDWLLLGGGYLYSKLDGDGGFNVELLQLTTPGSPITPVDASNPIVLQRESHIGNLSSLWGPWEGLTLSAGVQNEWTHEDGFGQGLLQLATPDQPAIEHQYSSQRDKVILSEDFGLRYTRIPFTVLFADARFRQEWVDLSETDLNSTSGPDFLRNSDIRMDVEDIRTGFTISPWTPVSLEADYRKSMDRTQYHHLLDTTPTVILSPLAGDPGNGYPSFFRRRSIDTDEVEAKLVWRVARWVKTTFKYELVSADYQTVTDPSFVAGFGELPGGAILAGNYDAHIYSVNTTLTPWRRVNFSTTFSYTTSRTVSGVNGRVGIVPYEGDIYSVLNTANFIVSKATDFNLSYVFSRADYRQPEDTEALPLGISYTRHGLIAGLSRRFGPRITAGLQYGFFYYDEPTAGGATDYTAHAIFGSVKVQFE